MYKNTVIQKLFTVLLLPLQTLRFSCSALDITLAALRIPETAIIVVFVIESANTLLEKKSDVTQNC